MIQLRPEERKLLISRRETERDVAGRASQLTVWFDCPFCGALIKARVWSLCGRGKRCACDAMFHMQGTRGVARKLVDGDQAINAAVCFVTRETSESRPGRFEVEVFAPEGRLFNGASHSMRAIGSTLAEATESGLASARSTRLVPYTWAE